MNILALIYEAIDEVNEDLEIPVPKTEDAVLFGTESSLDSLGLVNLITVVEQKIEEQTGNFISIADEKAMSQLESPFKTIGTLEAYIKSILNA